MLRCGKRQGETPWGNDLQSLPALACIAVAGGVPRAAEDYPNRPVRVIVGFSPGSGADITARVVGQRMGQLLGQQFVVENKTGAGSSLAAEFVARAPKDGYTLLLATIANTINAAMSSNLSFDFPKDFVPIVRLTTMPNILVVHPSVGVKSVKELIALAKASPTSCRSPPPASRPARIWPASCSRCWRA